MKKSTGKSQEVEEQESEETTPFKVNDRRLYLDDADEESLAEAVEELPSFVGSLKKKAEESEKQLQEYIAAYKQKISENDSFRKRMEDNVHKMAEQARSDVINSFLPLADNLDRAINAVENGGDEKSLLEGIKMVQTLFRETLKQNGLTVIETMGSPFDPNEEEAVAVEEVSEEEKDNMVLEEYEKGYKIGERLLRPAKVKVGRFSGQQKAEGRG